MTWHLLAEYTCSCTAEYTYSSPKIPLAAIATAKRPLCVFQSHEIARVHRERLLSNGFLQEGIKGWLISSGPNARAGDSTPWYASFWEFCASYCKVRFGKEWHLSPEQSLLLHSENTVIPTQAIVNSPRGTNNKLDLLFGTSLYDLKAAEMPPKSIGHEKVLGADWLSERIPTLTDLRLTHPEFIAVKTAVPKTFSTDSLTALDQNL